MQVVVAVFITVRSMTQIFRDTAEPSQAKAISGYRKIIINIVNVGLMGFGWVIKLVHQL